MPQKNDHYKSSDGKKVRFFLKKKADQRPAPLNEIKISSGNLAF